MPTEVSWEEKKISWKRPSLFRTMDVPRHNLIFGEHRGSEAGKKSVSIALRGCRIGEFYKKKDKGWQTTFF